MEQTLILSANDIEKCLTPRAVIEAVEFVFAEWGRGNVVMPAKITLDMSRCGREAWSNAMPAYLVSRNVAGIKWIGGYELNRRQGRPYITGSIILSDPQTGHTLSFMDGGLITNMRTGASAAVAAKYLTRRPLRIIAIIGAGTQGRTCAICLNALFPETRFQVADIAEEARNRFAQEMSQSLNVEITAAETTEQALQGADLAVVATTARTPHIRDEWVASGATILAMSSFPQIHDAFALSADRIVVDSWEQASHRGEISHLVEHGEITRPKVHAELGSIVAGLRPGRELGEHRLLAVLVGLGAHDICVARDVYRKALKMGLGKRVDM